MCTGQQMCLFSPDDEASFITMHNALCMGAWDITPMAHDVLMLVAKKYKELHEIQVGTESNPKLEYIDLKISEIVGYGANDRMYKHARNLLNELRSAGVTMAHNLTPGELELEGIAIFCGRMWYSEKKDRLRIALNKDLKDFFEELGANYTKLFITEMLSLPNTLYSKIAYQFFKSLEFKRQFEISIEALLRTFGCTEKYPKWNDFEKRVLKPSVDDINERTSLHFKYEPQHGQYNKVNAVRFWYQSPEKLFPPQQETKQVTEQKAKPEIKTQREEKQGQELKYQFKARPGTAVFKVDDLTVKSNGFIEGCYEYVKEHGEWIGEKGNKVARFPTKSAADEFMRVCEQCGLKANWN